MSNVHDAGYRTVVKYGVIGRRVFEDWHKNKRHTDLVFEGLDGEYMVAVRAREEREGFTSRYVFTCVPCGNPINLIAN